MHPKLPATVDVIVVGARCAGAATAMLLARAGRHVLLIDRGEYGTDILSTHALMRGGVLQLARWNLLDRIIAAGTPPVTVTTFHGDRAHREEVAAIAPRGPGLVDQPEIGLVDQASGIERLDPASAAELDPGQAP